MKLRTIIIVLIIIIVAVFVGIKFTYAPEPIESLTPKGLPHAYFNSVLGFSLYLPEGYTIDETYHYQTLDSGKDIGGVKFTIALSIAAGTNLGADSYISVEKIPQAKNCSSVLFLNQEATTESISEGDVTYSVTSSTGAGAGNRYEETVYALPGTNPCVAVRYFIHYGVIENYSLGVVREFDKPALLKQFDAIRHTLVIRR